MTTLPPLRNAADAYVAEKTPSRNYNSAQRIYLADGAAANTRYGYIYFGVPSGLTGKTITSAKLRLYSGAGFAGAVTLSLQRLAAKFSVNRINWNNKPGVTGAVKSLTKTDAPAGTMWEFDVQDVMQQIANGLPWYGFRISATNSTAKWLHSAQAAEQYRPVLEIVWSDAPDQPDNLRPDDGISVSVDKPTLQWSFIDHSGDTTMQSFHLKLFSTKALADANGAGDVLDVTVPSTVPQYDLDASTYAGLAAGGTLYWRVQNTDGAGIVSAWSDVAYFTRTTKGTATITNPAAAVAPNPAFVNDPTPPFSWTFTGRTQLSYEILLSTPEEPEKILWRATSQTTETAVTPPPGKITQTGKTYRVTLRIYDTIDRANLPDDKPYVEVYRDFVFTMSNTVTPVSGLTGTPDTFRSRMVLEWTIATAPDSFVILRDGKVIDEMAPVDLLVGGTTYRYKDDEARPRVQHTWSVAAKVNGVTSSGNPTVSGLVKPITTTLSETDGDRTVYLFDPGVEAERDESSEIHYVLGGGAPPVLITQSLRGYAGSVTGVLLNDTIPGLSAAGQLDNLIWFREHPGTVLKLVWVDKVLRVVVRNVTDEPIAYPDGSAEYRVSFDFFEV